MPEPLIHGHLPLGTPPTTATADSRCHGCGPVLVPRYDEAAQHFVDDIDCCPHEPWVSRDVAAERQPYTASLRDRLAVPVIQAAFRLASPSYRGRIHRLIVGGMRHGH